ncbi:MAG: putative sulfate exporter family transporter, partial [Pseudomonadota bacterium]
AGVIPAPVTAAASQISSWALLSAIAAVGVKTSLGEVIEVGGPAIALLVLETIFIAALVIACLVWLLPVA